MLGWIVRTIAIGLAKAITLGEYQRIKRENKLADDYVIFIKLMDAIAKKRFISCRPDELSEGCPQHFSIDQYYQDGKTTSGTAALRIYTIVGSDGQTINIQGFDLLQKIKVTVRHTNGKMDLEEVTPSDALKRIEREAGYLAH